MAGHKHHHNTRHPRSPRRYVEQVCRFEGGFAIRQLAIGAGNAAIGGCASTADEMWIRVAWVRKGRHTTKSVYGCGATRSRPDAGEKGTLSRQHAEL